MRRPTGEAQMSTDDVIDPAEPRVPERVSCEVCRRELPAEQALHQEAEDYALWFCGHDCYAKWRRDNAADGDA
jgi:hypothetical protein